MLIATGAGLTLVLCAGRPWAVDIGAPGDAYAVGNVFLAEGTSPTLRWTRDASELRLPGAYAGTTALALRLYHEPLAANVGQTWELQLAAAGASSARFTAADGWRVYHLLLPPNASRYPLQLGSPTFQPGPNDPRQLGIALDWLRVEPLERAGVPIVAAGLRATWLVVAVALVGAAAALLDNWSVGAAGRTGRPWRVVALLAGLGLALVAWAAADPPSLAWMLPTSWPTLALFAVALAGSAGLGIALGQWGGRKGILLPARPRDPDRSAVAAGKQMFVSASNIGIVIGLCLAHAGALAPLPVGLRGAAALAILGAPGAIAALALFRAERDWLERLLLATAGSIGVAALLVLGLHALPGPLSAWLLLACANGLSLVGLRALRQPAPLHAVDPTAPARADRWLLGPMIIAAGLRLPLLGRAEFQGDEAYVLMLARGVRYGQPDILFVHMKGPVEALLPAGPLVITGVINEWVARLPFAVAGMACLLGVWLLAGRLLGGVTGNRAGLVAVAALAVDGFLIAFSRIVQYQSVVLLLSLSALWLCWRFYEGAARPGPYLFGAAFCVGVALIAHYDGIFVGPALAWLVIAGGRRRGYNMRQWAAALAGPLALGLIITLSFYLPFVTHEHFVRTVGHLATRSGQGGSGPALFNNLIGYAQLAGFYSFGPALLATGLALLGGLAAWLAIFVGPRPLGLALAALLVGAGLLATIAPGLFAIGPDHSLAGLALAPPIIGLALAPRLPAGMRALLLWFAAPFLLLGFLFADPRSHFYSMHPAGALLAGLAVALLYERIGGVRLAWLRRGFVGAGLALLVAALPYAQLVFLRQRPEYQRAYPATQLAIYRPLTGENLADDGYFGMPQQDGWKTVGELFRRDELRGTIGSNQELFTSGWYLRGQFMCARDPDYFIVAEQIRPYYIPPGYDQYAAVSVAGVRTLTIYSRAPVIGPPRSLDATDYTASFDSAAVPDFPLRRLLSGVVPQHTAKSAWQAGFGLRGYDLDRNTLGPGDSAFLTLYWRAERQLDPIYQPVVQIRDAAGHTLREAPTLCGGAPSDAWFKNYVNDTPFAIRADDLLEGRYTLELGVRDLASGALLPLDTGADTLLVGEIEVTR